MKEEQSKGNRLTLTPKQRQIIKFMQDGCPLLIGQSDTDNSIYYMVAATHDKGFGNTYFNATVFGNLIGKGIIYHNNSEWVLTELGESIQFHNTQTKHIKP